MSVKTGENEQGLKKIMDLTRAVAVVMLVLHFYYQGYVVFRSVGWTAIWSDNVLKNVARSGLFSPAHKAKLVALVAITLTLIGTKGKKDQRAGWRVALVYITLGCTIYFGSYMVMWLSADAGTGMTLYIAATVIGLLLYMHGGATIARILKVRLDNSVFNDENETFPQEERMLRNEHSIHFETSYRFKNKVRRGRINIVAPFRGTLLVGNPGSGKTRWLVKPMIHQFMQKKYAMVIFDFKYPDLTEVAFGAYLRYRHLYMVEPEFAELNFDDPLNRCNPLMPETLHDISDATEASRTLLLSLNQDWITKHGDFWVESAISFFTAVIWYLRNYEDGKFCTIPHCIELLQTDYDKLFSVLRMEPTIEPLIKPFINAYHHAPKMLEGMMANLTVSLGKLSSENIYYVLSGNDITLDVANPKRPKILCLASNPQKANIYGALVSLYITAIKRSASELHQHPLCMMLEEFASIYFSGIDRFLAYCRSYLIAVVMVVQDISQLSLYYGKEQASVIMNVTGNLISGQASGETAEQFSRKFGKIKQDKESVTINSSDSSLSRSTQLDFAIPASTIAALSSGEFCGIVADSPEHPIKLKKFHGTVELDDRIDSGKHNQLPPREKIDVEIKRKQYMTIKKEAKQIVLLQLTKMLNTPSLAGLVVTKRL